MDYEASQKIQPHLARRETLLWSGRPRQGFFLRRSDLFLIPFSLVWCSIVIASVSMAFLQGHPLIPLFAMPLILVGIYLAVGRFVIDSLVRRGTFYGLTDDRVLIVTQFPMSTMKSLELSSLSNLMLTSSRDKSGSIWFDRPQQGVQWLSGLHWPGSASSQGPHFDSIENVQGVYDTLLKAQQDQEYDSQRRS